MAQRERGGRRVPSAITPPPAGAAQTTTPAAPYQMIISRLTVEKLGVKLYDKASAVVAELIANGYDADAAMVTVELPLGHDLAHKGQKKGDPPTDLGYEIVVRDTGHGMTPEEAQAYFLVVGADRRKRAAAGARSRERNRLVMGRKGIGKLAPFGICRRIEVISSGGAQTPEGYLTSHFIMDFDRIVQQSDAPVPLDAGALDRTFREQRGTEVRLTQFLSKRVPAASIFLRQLARRFALADPNFVIAVRDNLTDTTYPVPAFKVPLNEETKIDVTARPVPYEDDELPVTGWMAFAAEAYKDEEEAGVRIYARGKIVATTRDFEQPAGFTGEYTTRSYLVGEIHAEWLDEDDDDDLVRTDRQGILWDSEKGEALREWGKRILREIGAASKKPRRANKARMFMERSNLAERAQQRFGNDASVVEAVVELGNQIGAFASEDELGDPEYVEELRELILSVGPHQALINAFKEISGQPDRSLDDLLVLFGKTRVAEMASYAQIASERVRSIQELERIIHDPDAEEPDLQRLIAAAPWLIQPDWSVLTANQGLKAFRDQLVHYWRTHHGEELEVAVTYERKRPDFTLVAVDRRLEVVELKKPQHAFNDTDYTRFQNYLDAFDALFEQNPAVRASFPEGYHITLIADSVAIQDATKRRAFDGSKVRIDRQPWGQFLTHARVAHEEFLRAHDNAAGAG